MKGYADLADLPEDERITLIGRQIMQRPAPYQSSGCCFR